MMFKGLNSYSLAFIGFTLIWISTGLNTYSQNGKTIIIENADITQFETINGKKTSRLIGNVRFKHEDALMSCDSAHYLPEENTLDAFSNVHIWKGDTLNLYGNFVKYRGNDRIAEIRKNVKLIDKENHLTTNHIDYDLNNDFGYYLGGGRIINGNNILTSLQGYYYSKEKLFFFKDSVVVTNPEYVMYSDTLKYNTVSEIAYFLGPTDIKSDSNFIYCENGWYDTKLNISQFNKNAYIETKDKKLSGDSLYYERENGIGKAFDNIVLEDTANKIILYGNKAIYYEKVKYAMVTDSALMVLIDKNDSLYVHADTLKTEQDTIPDLKIIKAYRHVKFYRKDLQGKCDTLIYSDIDSIFQLHGEPVLWSDENQLTAQYISIETKNQTLYKINMQSSAFIISIEDSSRFNQIKGRNMEGYFRNNELKMIDVTGNGQTIYYAKEKGDIQGVNTASSSNIKIYLTNRKIEKISFLNKPDAIYYPLSKFPEKGSKLEKFRWFGEYRPMYRYDVFRWDQPFQDAVVIK
jgi:lipopolysaccharide export system protein LptA